MVRVKICCIQSIEEAQLAVRAGADALGFVSAMPSGPGVIPEERIATLVAQVPPPVASFLLTSRTQAPEIVEQHRRCRTTTLQLVDRIDGDDYATLRRELPGVRIVQVVHVLGPSSLDEAVALAPGVDALLLDSGNPTLRVKELGGTGRVHDWSVARAIVEAVRVPVFLAGGLHPGNVREAIDRVGPFALDVCSGVRTDGRLDSVKLRAFLGAAGRPLEHE
jgi:phosphoribosylanthranilate isomerase